MVCSRVSTTTTLLASLCVAFIAACAESDDRPRYRVGEPSDAQVSTLDEGQLAAVCDTFTVYVDTYVDLDAIAYTACLPAALVTSTDPEQCEVNLANCMAVFPEPIAIRRTETVEACSEDLRDCQATVGQFEDCVNARVDLAVGNYSCSGAGDRGYVAEFDGLATVCADIDSLCDQYDQQYGPE